MPLTQGLLDGADPPAPAGLREPTTLLIKETFDHLSVTGDATKDITRHFQGQIHLFRAEFSKYSSRKFRCLPVIIRYRPVTLVAHVAKSVEHCDRNWWVLGSNPRCDIFRTLSLSESITKALQKYYKSTMKVPPKYDESTMKVP